MIEIDGKDGGGQVLRTVLSLSMVTGQPFRMVNIRGRRKKPGLMRQHLTCVKAAAEVSGAETRGAEMHSTELEFTPNKVQAGDYEFAIGSAGSTTLVFQTLLPALMLGDAVSSLKICGGTHNPLAPSADYLEKIFLPLAGELGVCAEVRCDRVGFAPASGGVLGATIRPSILRPQHFTERGELVGRQLCGMVANLSGEIMQREVAHAAKRLAWDEYEEVLNQVKDVEGTGNVFAVQLDYQNLSERFTGYGAHGLRAENVAGRVVKVVKEFFTEPRAALGEHLADQILLPMAMSGGGSFTTSKMTNHLRTNIKVIEAFLDVEIGVEYLDKNLLEVSV